MKPLPMKKPLLFPLLTLLICAAAAYFILDAPKDAQLIPAASLLNVHTPSPTLDPFKAYQLKREQTHSAHSAALNVLLNSAQTDDATRDAAQKALLQFAACLEKELRLEAALAALSIEGIVSVSDTSVYIYTRQPLDEAQVRRLYAAAHSTTGTPPNDIYLSDNGGGV